ncbi:MAG TPA: biopolymer transporter ExbB, partial [Verrucomicrobiales bacterium]|nr:biopolymer transporter ExbB [Verrucomicrobiales bacterium]
PLLGLFGTVLGMISVFTTLSGEDTVNAAMLAGGISEALITTEYGLIIAVPCLLLHALLNRKAKGVISGMEQTAVGFINGLPNR